MKLRRITAIACCAGFFAAIWLLWAIEEQVISGQSPTCAQTVEILVKGRSFQVCRITQVLHLLGLYGSVFFFGAGIIVGANRRRK
jgi:hypothetical protein